MSCGEFSAKGMLMPAGKMHVDEVDTNVSLVGRLLATQFPQWSNLPIEPIRSAGTDNALYRLGVGDPARDLIVAPIGPRRRPEVAIAAARK